YK
ncbi:hypothetical protein VCHC77A1_3030B, partial [Vibrio cholerae HC-77A1]